MHNIIIIILLLYACIIIFILIHIAKSSVKPKHKNNMLLFHLSEHLCLSYFF